MICPTHVNRCRHRYDRGAKDADRLWPIGTQPVAPPAFGAHGLKAAGVQAGTTSFVSLKRKKVSPMLRPLGAGAPQGALLRQRAEEAGRSEGRSVTERIGV